jgi:nucleoside phosphorylase
MRILVTFAVGAEFEAWRARRSFIARKVELKNYLSDESYYETQIGNSSVVVYLTGIGWKLPLAGLRNMMSEPPDACISAGFAGGLRTQYEKGDVVAAALISSRETRETVGSNARLLEIAADCGAKIAEKCMTNRNILGKAQFKRAMGEFADIVDMESFHVMTMATGPQIRAITIRAISDTVDEDMPLDFGRILARNGEIIFHQLLLHLDKHPHRVPALIRFGRQSRRAGQKLADFLDRYIAALEKEFESGISKKRQQAAVR